MCSPHCSPGEGVGVLHTGARVSGCQGRQSCIKDFLTVRCPRWYDEYFSIVFGGPNMVEIKIHKGLIISVVLPKVTYSKEPP